MDSGESLDPLVYRVDEVAALLKISPWMVYEMIRRDEIPGVVGINKRNVRVLKSAFNAWLEEGGSRGAGS
jgi:excisionase family DNA binding protein